MNAKEANSKTKGTQVFNVPNDEKGQAFMRQAAEYLNRPVYGIVRRGRGERPSRRFHQSLPLSMSEWIAVYVKGGDIEQLRKRAWKESNEKAELERQVELLKRDNANAQTNNLRLSNRVGELKTEIARAEKKARMHKLTDENLAKYREQNEQRREIKTVKLFGFNVKTKIVDDTLVIG